MIAGTTGIFLHKGLSKKITILGKDAQKNMLIVGLPIVAFSIVGLNNNFGVNKWVYRFAYALLNTVYAFTEEFGWRKY